MRRVLLITTAIFFLASSLEAQPRKGVHEVGPSLGISSFFGDLGGADRQGRGLFFDFDVDATKPAFGLLYRWNINKLVAFRAQVYYAYVSGNDAYTTFRPRAQRNLHFQSEIIEGTVVFELNLAKFEIGTDNKFAPYVFVGIGAFSMNPQALDDRTGEWVDLQPLGTEGQNLVRYPDREPYALTQMVVPYGAGFKFGVTPNWALALEFAPRLTFTDYIDDVSKTYVTHVSFESAYFADRSGDGILYVEGNQRGDPSHNDSYFFGGLLSLTYKIGSKPKRYTCPKFNLGNN